MCRPLLLMLMEWNRRKPRNSEPPDIPGTKMSVLTYRTISTTVCFIQTACTLSRAVIDTEMETKRDIIVSYEALHQYGAFARQYML
jgi:hypothetical protein